MNEKLIQYLSRFVADRRVQLFDSVLSRRPSYVTVVLEDIYQAHNASAVLRSCECFGIQDVHIIENTNQYKISPDVALGSNKWLNIYRYNQHKHNTTEALQKLRQNGYRIVATTPHRNDCSLSNFNLSAGKVALVFGSELNGLSGEAIGLADEFLKIDMAGFTESLNISVTAALCIHHLTTVLRNDASIHWEIPSYEQAEIKLNWLRSSINKSDLIEKAFYDEQGTKMKED